MTVADYFIDFLIENDVTDVFGYQGGMIAYLFDSLGERKDRIVCHSCATEQGAALAACGYAQATGKMGIVLSTSGPGFTNLLTGMANAWFDSLPMLCISGQVNTKDKRRNLSVRQFGFQEIQAPEMAKVITKKTYEIDNDTDIEACLEEAWTTAIEGRKGPVFIELPINICRNEIDPSIKKIQEPSLEETRNEEIKRCIEKISRAKKPVIIAGAGINQAGLREEFKELVELLKIPVITTLPAIDLLPTDNLYRVGYLGGTARREAGVVLAEADLVLSLGTRLCAKQIGYHMEFFAPKAKLIRVDIDSSELERTVKKGEQQINIDLRIFISESVMLLEDANYIGMHSQWVSECTEMKHLLAKEDVTYGNVVVNNLTECLPDGYNITLDVGNNMNYGAQSSVIRNCTRVFTSAGFGAMGYALPAAIGATIGNKKPTCVISGDGGLQMNIQELNFISKKKLPIKVFVLNNKALGHILLFQKAYLEERYHATDEKNGDYFSCDFVKIAEAYGIRGYKIKGETDIRNYTEELRDDKPALFELEYEDCPLLPNIHGGNDCLLSGPKLDEVLIDKIRALGFSELKAEE